MLDLDNVTVRYANRVTALEAASASFPRGQFIVLLGPSGAGKSTLLRCLNGLVRPTCGKVSLEEGGDILASRAALRQHRRRTGMIFQQHHLIGRLTALQNVLMGRLAFHTTLRSLLPLPEADRLVALEALDRVGLADRALHRADQLSGGQQQRVGIARALAQKPNLILADEPVASLDPATADKVLALLHRICCEDGITAVVSLHQVELARRYGGRIYGLAGGHIVFDGAAAELDAVTLDRIYGPASTPSTPSVQPASTRREQNAARPKMAKTA
ncbi:MAG: phosphonate ABC transporter ATP-binding protein [Parvibaculum sp.]|nr:phosphonate ABC transporter ATP-binding protein [Parvibaculum sp.]